MRYRLFALCLMTTAATTFAYAEEVDPKAVTPSAEAGSSSTAAPVLAPPTVELPSTAAPLEAGVPADAVSVPAAPTPEVLPGSIPQAPVETVTDNLEFISGEISAMDEASKSVSVKLYGDETAAASEKVFNVSVDENTDITDGEQDRALKSLTVGTEVDVEYDPATSKATYIFVY